MSFAKQHILSASVVACATLAVLAGHLSRNEVERGSSPRIVLDRSQSLLVSSTTVDEISAMEFYSQMTGLLQNLYVDPITDESKLLAGSVRGMVASLRDSRSFFLPEAQWKSFEAARQGKYEGIGADFILDPSIPTDADGTSPWGAVMPRLVLATVVPGGPADKAGMKAGDVIEDIDGHWVANGEIVARFLKAIQLVRSGKGSQAELDKIREEYRQKSAKRTSPWKAMEKLSMGKTGDVKVGWKSGARARTASLTRAESQAESLVKDGSMIKIRVQKGLGDSLKKAVNGLSSVTLDLRQNAYGDPDAVPELIGVLKGTGSFGELTRTRDDVRRPLEAKGESAVAQLKVIVDASTHDSAQVLALALKEGGATLDDRGMKASPVRIDRVSVDKVGGYTLTRDRFDTSEKAR